jgi:death on curing protein
VKWVWPAEDVILAIHDEQIGEHGGASRVRDLGLLQSALARPRNLVAYEDPDAAALAASYAFGIARNHAFIDGNKRTAFVAAELFLALNGFELTADDVECVTTMLQVADGSLQEASFAKWIRSNLRKL